VFTFLGAFIAAIVAFVLERGRRDREQVRRLDASAREASAGFIDAVRNYSLWIAGLADDAVPDVEAFGEHLTSILDASTSLQIAAPVHRVSTNIVRAFNRGYVSL
jgi:hypothetical protein